MLYAVPHPSSSLRPYIVRDAPRAGFGLGEDLREFIMDRLDKVNPFAESNEYCRQREIAGRLQNGLEALLSEEGRIILREYGEALESAHLLETEILAERAFLDGVRVIIRAMMNDEL